jgi:hypothetical protein
MTMAPPSKTLWSMEISSPIFFGCEEKGKEVLEAVDDYIWDVLD